MFSKHDIEILRPLAKRVREIADLPEMEEKRAMWRDHTSLRGKRPPIFVDPGLGWMDVFTPGTLKCEGGGAAKLEKELRKRLFFYDVVKDDTPIEKDVDVPRTGFIGSADWGVKPQIHSSPKERGAFRYIPIIEEPSDWKKLSKPEIPYIENAEEVADEIREAVGDLLDVHLTGVKILDFHLAELYTQYRGLDNMLYDLIDEPEMVEEVFSFFEEGTRELGEKVRPAGRTEGNADYTHHYTGGIGYTHDLPVRPGAAPDLCDMWGAGNDEEYACVSPEMFAETVFPHTRRLIEPFGLTGYGCCDDLTDKLDTVLTIKNLRRVAACPWANLEKMADRLKKDYILTWKPNPAYLATDYFNEAVVEQYLTDSLRQAKAGYPEIILRDTNTCRNEPERFGRFVALARKAIATVYGEE